MRRRVSRAGWSLSPRISVTAVRGLQLRKRKLPKPNNRKIDDPLSLLGKVAINLDRMHFSVNGDVSVIRSCELYSLKWTIRCPHSSFPHVFSGNPDELWCRPYPGFRSENLDWPPPRQ